MPRKKSKTKNNGTTANLGYEAQLWGHAMQRINFNKWRGEFLKVDKGWAHGMPQAGSAAFGWMRHFNRYLAQAGMARFAVASGAMSLIQSGHGATKPLRVVFSTPCALHRGPA